jgi:hypothetical protein
MATFITSAELAAAQSMKAIVASAVLCAGLAGTAHAKCGTKQLDGNWRITRNLLNINDATINNGILTVNGEFTTQISQSSTCRVKLTLDGTIVTGSSEAIGTGSPLKPRKIYIGAESPFLWYVLHRR